MVKTTVYLESSVALQLKQLAAAEGRPQAEMIRDAVAAYTRKRQRPAIPGVGEFDSGETTVSERAEEILRNASKLTKGSGKWRSSRGARR